MQFESSPAPFPPVALSRQQVVSVLTPGGRGEERDGGGAKSYDGEKAWSYINNSILSDEESMGVGLPSYTQKPVCNPDLRNPRNVAGVGDQLAQPLIQCYRKWTDKL
jgi:hypothetical protein